MKRNERLADFTKSIQLTVPVLLGFIAIGISFGLMASSYGLSFIATAFMSFIVYAGAMQYALILLMANSVPFSEIAIATILINFRHIFYGLALASKYKGCGWFKPYLIFGLTDETYALISTADLDRTHDKKRMYIFITALNHLYWVTGSICGYILGKLIKFDFSGAKFALTALFIVLLIEQWKKIPEKTPFITATFCSIIVIIIFPIKHMLILSFLLSFIALIILRKLKLC